MSFRLPWVLALVTALVVVIVLTDSSAAEAPQESSRRTTQWSERGDSTAYIDALIFAAAQQAHDAQAAEDARLAEEARIASQQAAPQRVVPQPFDYPAECEGHPIPAYIIWRESHCNYGSVNPTGCGGYGCVGMYQFDMRHWTEGGGCAWLGDWTVPANQDACADQMSRGGTYLAPWGG